MCFRWGSLIESANVCCPHWIRAAGAELCKTSCVVSPLFAAKNEESRLFFVVKRAPLSSLSKKVSLFDGTSVSVSAVWRADAQNCNWKHFRAKLWRAFAIFDPLLFCGSRTIAAWFLSSYSLTEFLVGSRATRLDTSLEAFRGRFGWIAFNEALNDVSCKLYSPLCLISAPPLIWNRLLERKPFLEPFNTERETTTKVG